MPNTEPVRDLIKHVDELTYALQSDCEQGCHSLNNAHSERFQRDWPELNKWLTKLTELREKITDVPVD